MENKVKELREMKHDITSIIENSSHPRVIRSFYRQYRCQDIVIPVWTEESITEFSNTIYEIVTRRNNGQKEDVFNGEIRGD